MGWLRTLLGWRDAPTSEHNESSVTFSTELATPIDELISQSGADVSNQPVNRARALTVPAVLRGRNLLCSLATLPLQTRAADLTHVRSPLLEQIDPNVTNVVTLAQTVEDLIFEGIAWWRITDRLADGFPRSAMHVDREKVSLQPPPGASREALRTLPSGEQLGGVVWVDGKPVPGRDMVRFDSPNPGLLKAAARSVRRAIVLERTATMYANDPRAQEFFTPAENADPVEDDEIKEILAEWQKSRRTLSSAYVPASLKLNTVDSMSPAELQLVELQKQVTVDLANAMGIDPEDLGVSTTSRTYANATDRRRDRINDTLAPFMRAITDRLSMNDITKRGQHVAFDLDDYMRADPTTRWSTYEVGLRNEIVTVPEVREAEGLPAVPVERTPRPQPAPQQEAPVMSTTPATARFSSDDTSTRVAFEIPAADAQFRVNREKRTISGLLVPWNKVARSGYAKWSFGKDSLTWTEEARVKLNREHNRRESVGVATRLQSTAAGLDGSFKVARGTQGDEVLSLAEDGVLDGFSIEVDFDDDGTAWARDPDDDMVRQVKSGRLAAVAITASPAFDDARVSGVAASRKEPDMSTKPAEPNAPEAPANGPDTTAAFTAAVEAFTSNAGAFTDAVKQLVEVQHSGEGPAFVDPTRRTAQFEVNEEPLYRFDGTRGTHDFSSDIIAGAKGDYDAMKRAEQWLSTNFAVDSTGTKALNPDRQRPDLYVDQLEFVTPLWNSINKGTIPDNTPFVLPKFDTSSGLVGDHAEGTEPTPGALTATSQTITPSPVSGKVEVTREAWDQGGSPQLSTILWRQMVRAYDESLEQASADMLDALTVTEITLTADAADSALASEVKQALAALHFVRGGNRFRDFKLERGLYVALADAKASDGRPLFPILNPQNADGRTDAFFGAVSIGGLAGIPSWALPTTIVGAPNTPGNSYLYNREDVSGWASAPQRLDFQYRVAFVDVAIWGYKALAATRADGVRRIKYDDGSA